MLWLHDRFQFVSDNTFIPTLKNSTTHEGIKKLEWPSSFEIFTAYLTNNCFENILFGPATLVKDQSGLTSYIKCVFASLVLKSSHSESELKITEILQEKVQRF